MQVWLDNLYFRLSIGRRFLNMDTLEPDNNGNIVPEFWVFLWARGGDTYATELTLQGNGDGQKDCLSCGLAGTRDGKIFAQGTYTKR